MVSARISPTSATTTSMTRAAGRAQMALPAAYLAAKVNPPRVERVYRCRVCAAAARLIEGHLAASDDAVSIVSDDMCVPCAADSDEPQAQRDRREAMEALALRVAQGIDIRLLCWCAPARCHADDIARVVRARAETLWRASPRKRSR